MGGQPAERQRLLGRGCDLGPLGGISRHGDTPSRCAGVRCVRSAVGMAPPDFLVAAVGVSGALHEKQNQDIKEAFDLFDIVC